MLKWKVFLFSLCVFPSAGGGGGSRVWEAAAGGDRDASGAGVWGVGDRGALGLGEGPERGSGICKAGDRVGRASPCRGRGPEGLKLKGVSVEGEGWGEEEGGWMGRKVGEGCGLSEVQEEEDEGGVEGDGEAGRISKVSLSPRSQNGV